MKEDCQCSKNIKRPETHQPPNDGCECGTEHNQISGRCIVCGGQVYVGIVGDLAKLKEQDEEN